MSEPSILEISRLLGAAEYRRDSYRHALELIIAHPQRAAEIAKEALEIAGMVEKAMGRFHNKCDERT